MNLSTLRHKAPLAAALLLISATFSCTDDFALQDPEAGQGEIVSIKADISQTSTRADESGFAAGDRMGVYVVTLADGMSGRLLDNGNHADNVAFTLDSGSSAWHAAADIYWVDKTTPADFYAYYPYDNSIGNVNCYPFEVAQDQSRPASDGTLSGYEASDFLWAKTPAATPGNRVDLTFRHRMAGVKVILEKGSGFTDTEWTKLPRIVTVDNTVRNAEIDLSTGIATPKGEYDRDIVMNSQGDNSTVYRAVTVPQTVAAGKPCIGITIDGVPYKYTRDSEMTYTAGKLHSFTIRIDKKETGGDYSLTLTGQQVSDWESDLTSHDYEANSYLVIHCPEAGMLKTKIRESGSDYSTVKNLKVTGVIDWTDFRFMKDEMSLLASLNLKEVRCVNAVTEYINGRPVTDQGLIDNAIPMNALADKETLRRLILPETVTFIGNNAFAHLRLTTTLIIPESVTVIDAWAFQCIGDEATIVLPNKLERIGDCAFYGLAASMELNFPASLKYIGGSAFYNAVNVTGTFSLPTGLEYIGENAFTYCGKGLTGDIVIPQAIVNVPNAFRINFAKGTTLTLHEGVRSIADGAFAGLKLNAPLILPKSLERIEREAFYNTRFCGKVNIPDNLQFLGYRAFLESSLEGELVFPGTIDNVMTESFGGTSVSGIVIGDNVLQINDGAFGTNRELKTVQIGKNVEFIGRNAFSNLPMLQTFISMSKNPPKAPEAFSGIYFDKCVLEVPVGCVDAYRNAEGWNRFMNITEHRELSFNIPDIACLDAGVTRTGIVRSEGAWSVSECPSWVQVSPSSGDNKEEVTVTVKPGSSKREGRIVFSLDGKGYTTYTTVRQLMADHAENKEIVLQTASAGATEVPVFIVGEGFSADDIVSGEYMRRMNETMEQFFDIEPYRSLRNYFTVTTAIACSPDRGTGDAGTVKTTCFDTNGVEPDAGRLREYVRTVSRHAGDNSANALIIMVCNHNAFQGWSEISHDGCAMASVGTIDDAYPYDQRGLVQHFAGGCAFAGLGEESVSHFEHVRGCTCPGCNRLAGFDEMKRRGFFENLSISAKMNDAPWRDFIFHENYSASVDMWEGGFNHLRGVWRSESQSVMGTYIRYFNAVSRYAIYKGVMRRSGKNATFDGFVGFDNNENQ